MKASIAGSLVLALALVGAAKITRTSSPAAGQSAVSANAILARLLGAGRPLYDWLPEKVQPIVPALVAVLPSIAAQFELVQTKLDFAEAVVGALGELGTGIRGGAAQGSARPI